MSAITPDIHPLSSPASGFVASLNSRYHKAALQFFTAIVVVHWLEHIVQAYQFYVLGWPRQMSMGLLGMYYPWLMKTETLHYGFAVVMLMGLWILRKGFVGTSYKWWMISFWIQFWHHIEHFLLFYQANTHHYFFGGKVPTSIGQIWIPRIELHLIYNTLVFIPMVVAMWLHTRPDQAAVNGCSCAEAPVHVQPAGMTGA